MKKFRYKGYDENSNLQTGTLNAENYSDAYEALKFQGITVVKLEPDKKEFSNFLSEMILKFRLDGNMQSVFFRELSVMLGVMTLHESLQTLAKSSVGHASEKILNDLISGVESGEKFSDAMRRHEMIFDADAINFVAIGETSGKLREVTEGLANRLAQSYMTRKKVTGALYYPLVVFIAALVAAAVTINVTLPVFENFYAERGDTLPLITLIFLIGGRFLAENFFLVLLAIFAGIFFCLFVYRTNPGVKKFIDRLKLEVKVVREIELRNLFSRLGFLTESGITLNEAIKLSADSGGNSYVREKLSRVQIAIERGEKLGDALKKNLKKISPLYLGLITTGEETGELVQMLEQCENMADFEIEETLRTLPAKAEVFGTLAAGAIVAALVFSIMLPIFEFTI